MIVSRPNTDSCHVIVDELEPGEPVFVVRGNDATALMFLRFYQTMNEDMFGPEKASSLEQRIAEFRTWRQGQRPLVKMPD